MSNFGWSYPPGCSGPPDDYEGPCEGCCQSIDDCVCDPCPVCQSVGERKCETAHGHTVHPAIKRLREVTEAKWKADAEAEARAEAKQFEDMTEDCFLPKAEAEEKDL